MEYDADNPDAELTLPFHLGVAGMIPTARVGRAHSYRARSASKWIVPAIPFSHFLKISLGSVIFPIETATNSHPPAPNSFSLVCIFSVSGSTSMILYWNRFDS